MVFEKFTSAYLFQVAQEKSCDYLLEQFSNDCRKTKTKAITLTNHNRSRQRDEPITIPSNFLLVMVIVIHGSMGEHFIEMDSVMR